MRLPDLNQLLRQEEIHAPTLPLPSRPIATFSSSTRDSLPEKRLQTEQCAEILASLSVSPPDNMKLEIATLRTQEWVDLPASPTASCAPLPSLAELDATIQSWQAADSRRSSDASCYQEGASYFERRGSQDSVASACPSMSSTSSSSSFSSPLSTPRTPSSAQQSFFSSPTFKDTDKMALHIHSALDLETHHCETLLREHWNKQQRIARERPIAGARITRSPTAQTAVSPPLKPVFEGVSRKARARPVPKTDGQGHFNKKYSTSCTDYIIYLVVDREMRWSEVLNVYHLNYERLTGRPCEIESQREIQGLQGVFYRINTECPALDDDGGLLFRDGKEYTEDRKQRKQVGRKLGLVDRYPERVVWENYKFIMPEEMARARELTQKRNRQRLEHGLPIWTPTNADVRVDMGKRKKESHP